eukprot:CAMPEP_0182499880 /NCGR_PEP_ID=MMETSP1321-20130603/8003_1 /TAXON_ID=91990 /ORGANISM="Bolidomonas sp., Strain RCC1657" /LENGTH=405 /DNA_ID=CAMNT_0024704129 /DNA_START=8 /DNA_END=1222 /DNA_ORIENTATION=+
MSSFPYETCEPVYRPQPQDPHTFTEPVAQDQSVLDLISSPHPKFYTRLLNLNSRLGPKAKEHNRLNPHNPIKLLGKAEFMNPGMSHKDRIAKSMLLLAQSRGDLLNSDGKKKTILAASSGNTGCSLALVGTLLGYEVIVITNKKCSQEKRDHIKANGATLWMSEDLQEDVDCLHGVHCYMQQEHVLCSKFPEKYFKVNQYDNLDNMAAHLESTGREIWEQTGGKITHFVMAGSTGGTIMGVGRYLKSKRANCEIVLSDPEKSNLMGLWEKDREISSPDCGEERLQKVKESTAAEGGVQLEGAGKGSLTAIMRSGVGALETVDACVPVNDFDAFDECRALAKTGVMCGGSSGLNICAARVIAERCADLGPQEGGYTITTILCDHGIKYMSKIYNDKWMQENDTRRK